MGMDAERDFFEMEFEGRTVIVEPMDHMRCRLVRLISPDPQDYLNPNFSPGNVIHFRP